MKSLTTKVTKMITKVYEGIVKRKFVIFAPENWSRSLTE